MAAKKLTDLFNFIARYIELVDRFNEGEGNYYFCNSSLPSNYGC